MVLSIHQTGTSKKVLETIKLDPDNISENLRNEVGLTGEEIENILPSLEDRLPYSGKPSPYRGIMTVSYE